jgi:plastocyanin
MLRRLLLPLALLGVALALAASGAAATPKLVGTTGPGFSIEVTKGGKDVKTLKAGTYTLVVHDKSSIHNFHLTGPGVNKKTSVGGTGTQTWTLKLKKGTYKYQCDIHAAEGMMGSFKVTS